MKLSVMVTFEDFVCNYGTWGRVGVWHVLARLKKSGVDRVYWRSRGNGQSEYPSRLTETKLTFYPDEFNNQVIQSDPYTHDYVNTVVNFDEFDHFKCARDRCGELGMEFVVWEETRGEDHGHCQYSQFVKRYPQFLSLRKDGTRAWSELGWSFPEVMDRRVGLFREVIGYEPDGIYFDFVKSGDDVVGRLDRDGYWCMGYEAPMVEGFKQATGRDPFEISNQDLEWLKYQSGHVTSFLRRCKEIRDTFFPNVKFGLFGLQGKYSASHLGKEANHELAFYPDEPLANLEDHKPWLEEGLIESFVMGHNCRGEFDIPATIPDQIRMHRDRLGDCTSLDALQIETYSDREAYADKWLDEIITVAENEGIKELIMREAHSMWTHRNMWQAVQGRFAK